MSALAAVAFLGLTGCAVGGPEAVLSSNGVYEVPAGDTTRDPKANLLKNFQSDAAAAASDRGSTAALQDFMRSGFLLVYSRCDEYFSGRGNAQARASLVRDSIAPVAAIVTGLIGLHSYKTAQNAERDIRKLALGSAATLASLDVYTEHFLFGADNIDSVRTLTLDAVTEHADAALGLNVRNFEEAALQIIDNQAHCTPARILALTRDAISKGQVVSRVSQSANVTEEIAFTAVANALGMVPPVMDEDEAGAIWAYAEGHIDTEQERTILYEKLVRLPAATRPIVLTSGQYQPNAAFPLEAIRIAFRSLPPKTTRSFQNTARALQDAAAEHKAVDKLKAASTRPDLVFRAADVDSRLRRIRIDIQPRDD